MRFALLDGGWDQGTDGLGGVDRGWSGGRVEGFCTVLD